QVKGQSDMVYSKLQVALSPHITFKNSEWYRHGYRLHNRQTNFYGTGYAFSHEWYDPASNTVGSQSSFDIQAPHDLVTVGGYWMHGDYHNPVALYTAAQGTSIANPAFFNSDYLYTDYGFLYIQDRVDLFNKKLIITPGLAEQMFRTAFYNTGLVDFPNSSPSL
ncbi:TonB-dependent receptor, partial [mine drainage metagenome]